LGLSVSGCQPQEVKNRRQKMIRGLYQVKGKKTITAHLLRANITLGEMMKRKK
jgi:hypothetical protein